MLANNKTVLLTCASLCILVSGNHAMSQNMQHGVQSGNSSAEHDEHYANPQPRTNQSTLQLSSQTGLQNNNQSAPGNHDNDERHHEEHHHDWQRGDEPDSPHDRQVVIGRPSVTYAQPPLYSNNSGYYAPPSYYSGTDIYGNPLPPPGYYAPGYPVQQYGGPEVYSVPPGYSVQQYGGQQYGGPEVYSVPPGYSGPQAQVSQPAYAPQTYTDQGDSN